jgi:hypothetical protein
MYVKLDRDACDHQLAICERCLGRFLEYPLGYERQCFLELRDDGKDILTVDMHTNGHDVRLELTDEQRKMLASEGWANFMDFAVPMYRE